MRNSLDLLDDYPSNVDRHRDTDTDSELNLYIGVSHYPTPVSNPADGIF